MDWYSDITLLLGTFCVIAIGMTIYARLNPTRPRFRRSNYVYTGIIPTITISSASPTKLSPTTLTPADSVDEDEHKSNESESPVDEAERARQLKCSIDNRLSVPDLDDDDDEEEEQQPIQLEDTSVSASKTLQENKVTSRHVEEDKEQPQVTGTIPNKKFNKVEDSSQAVEIKSSAGKDKSVSLISTTSKDVKEDNVNLEVVSLISTLDEDVKDDNDNSQARNLSSTPIENVVDTTQAVNWVEDEEENIQQSKVALLLDMYDDEDHSHTESSSGIDNVEDDYSQSTYLSELLMALDDVRSSPILNKNYNVSETDETSVAAFCNANKNLCRIGTSHTVEEPLFPFSEIVEEENPSARNRFKKRLSQ